MKRKVIRLALFLVPIVMGVSMVLVVMVVGGNSYGATIFESEQDYKLKFVDSTDFLSLSGTSAVILPFDIISAEDNGKRIKVTTHENAVIYETDYRDNGVYMKANLKLSDAGKFSQYIRK